MITITMLLSFTTPTHTSRLFHHHHHHLEMRFSQLADERTHKICTEANKKELLVTKLNRLRMLSEDIAKDAWMFET